MLRWHIICQQNGQGSLNAEGGTSPASGLDRRRASSAINAEAARPRGLMSGSARWLTSRAPFPRGSIGAPPERGVGVHMVRFGHVSVPDPRLALIKAWVLFVPES
jgi:hypothetical protein